jgi:hypothetical protein
LPEDVLGIGKGCLTWVQSTNLSQKSFSMSAQKVLLEANREDQKEQRRKYSYDQATQ